MLISYAAVLCVILIGFEIKVFDRTLMDLGDVMVDDIAEEMIPVTRQETPPPPPPPPPPAPPEEIEIVEDDQEVNETPVFQSEIDEKTEIAPMEMVQEEEAAPEIFVIVEDMPRFPGCEDEKSKAEKEKCAFINMQKFIVKNMNYPPKALDAGITGTVYVNFVVMPDGSIKDAKIARGIGGGCDEEALRVVSSMPKWKPGKQRGKPVMVSFNLPVKFALK